MTKSETTLHIPVISLEDGVKIPVVVIDIFQIFDKNRYLVVNRNAYHWLLTDEAAKRFFEPTSADSKEFRLGLLGRMLGMDIWDGASVIKFENDVEKEDFFSSGDYPSRIAYVFNSPLHTYQVTCTEN